MKASTLVHHLNKQIQAGNDLEIGIFSADLDRFVAANWVVIQQARCGGPASSPDDATLGPKFIALK